VVCPNCNTESGPSLFCYVCDAYLPSTQIIHCRNCGKRTEGAFCIWCGTPTPTRSDGVKASIPSRLGAFLLDGLVFLTLLLFICVIGIIVGVSVNRFYHDYGLEAFLIVFFGAGFGYLVFSLWFLARGQTPGKWLVDIRAADKRDGSKPGLVRMLLRETLGKWVSGCFFGLGWFWAIWDRDAQAWHDKIVRTVVLHRRTQTTKYPFLLVLVSAPVLSVGFIWAVVVHSRPPNVQSIGTEQPLSGDFVEETALSSLFGNYDSVEKSSSVTVIGRLDSLSHAGKLTLILDSPFSQRGAEKHLLVTSTTVEGEDCHACGARIGTYLFANRAGRWVPEIADTEVDQFGTFGHAFGIPDRDHPNGADGRAQAVKLGPDLYGFSLTGNDGAQGVRFTSELFIVPVENHYQPVLSLSLEQGNADYCGPGAVIPTPCYGYKSTVRLLNSAHAGYFDIEVDQAGTEYSDQGIIPANHKSVYFFSGDKYVVAPPSGSEAVPDGRTYSVALVLASKIPSHAQLFMQGIVGMSGYIEGEGAVAIMMADENDPSKAATCLLSSDEASGVADSYHVGDRIRVLGEYTETVRGIPLFRNCRVSSPTSHVVR